MLMVEEQSSCKAGMGLYSIFREMFVRGSQVLLPVEEARSCQKGTPNHDPPSSCSVIAVHVISNVEKASLVQGFEGLPAPSLVVGAWKRKSHPL